VTYENYLFYLETKRRMFGIPDPPHWEQVKETLERAKRGEKVKRQQMASGNRFDHPPEVGGYELKAG
jgi:hypothetical protein